MDTLQKEFEVKRISNGRGHSNLLAIVEEAVADFSIGSAVLVSYADGHKDPIRAVLQVDDKGTPIRANKLFAVVLNFIYE